MEAKNGHGRRHVHSLICEIWRFVSSWHDRWQQFSCCSSLCPSSPDLLSACLATSSLVFWFSSCHLLVSILSQTNYSHWWKLQDVSNEISSSRCYCVMQDRLPRSCHNFIVGNVITAWYAQDPPKAVMVEHISIILVALAVVFHVSQAHVNDIAFKFYIKL